jgi:group I intron endonuclease
MSRSRPNGIAYLYCITRIATGQKYIGLTIDPKVRWWTHCWSAGRSRQFIHRAIAKYGSDAFTFEIVACARTWIEGAETERRLIAQHRSFVKDGGYNLTTGGEGPHGRVCSEETRARIGQSRKGQPGRQISAAERDIHRKQTLQMYANHPEYRAELSKRSLESRIRNGNLGIGRSNSPDTIARMRKAARKRWSGKTPEQRSAAVCGSSSKEQRRERARHTHLTKVALGNDIATIHKRFAK